MVKAIVIIRESTTYQEIESQKKEAMEFAKKYYQEDEIAVVGKAGASAIKVDEHYKQIMVEVETLISNGGVECVFAWALDRIGRDEIQMYTFKKLLTDNKVQLRVLNPSLVLFNEDGSINGGAELSFALYVTMAKQEMEQKKARFKRTKDANSAKGKFNGGWCVKFGYKVDEDNNVVLDEVDSAFVGQIFIDFATGRYSALSLTKEYRERGITKPNGDTITEDFIRKTLRDTAYIGYTDIKGSHRKYIPIPAVVDVWDKVQKIKEGNNCNIGKSQGNRYWACLKLLKCKECGHNYMVRGNTYSCWLHYKKYMLKDASKQCSNNTCISAEYLDTLIIGLVAVVHESMVVSEMGKDKDELLNKIKVAQQKVLTYRKKADGIKDKKEKVAESYIDGLISKDKRDKKLQDVDREEKTIYYEMAAQVRYIDNLKAEIDALEEASLIDKDKGIRQTLKGYNKQQWQELVKKYVESIYLEKVEVDGRKYTRIEIEWKGFTRGEGRENYTAYYFYNPKYNNIYDRLYSYNGLGEFKIDLSPFYFWMY